MVNKIMLIVQMKVYNLVSEIQGVPKIRRESLRKYLLYNSSDLIASFIVR
jgi:hypothetical protein